jgi:hypothetical protein
VVRGALAEGTDALHDLVTETDQVVRLVRGEQGSAAAFEEEQGDVVVELPGDVVLQLGPQRLQPGFQVGAGVGARAG